MTTTSTPASIRTFATYNHWTGEQDPQGFEFVAYTATREEADAIAAHFPKSAKVRTGIVYSRGESSILPGHAGDLYYAESRTTLTSNGANGGVNETGMKRYRSIMKTIAKAELHAEWTTPFSNSYPTREAFEAATTI